MTQDAHQKVKATHLKRNAYLYVRQSTLRQVFENTESTQRQYALRQHAAAVVSPDYMPPETRSEIVSILAGLFVQKRWEATR